MVAERASPGLRALLPRAVAAYVVAIGSSGPTPALRRDAEFRAGRAAAAAALADLDDELGEVVLTPAEQTALTVADEPGLLGIVFSLKESAYKCWSPLLGAALDWTDIEVVLDRDALAFTADVVGPSARLHPPTVTGRYAVRDEHVLSAGWVGRG